MSALVDESSFQNVAPQINLEKYLNDNIQHNEFEMLSKSDRKKPMETILKTVSTFANVITNNEVTEVPIHGFKVKFDHKYSDNRKQSTNSSWRQIWALIPLVIRYCYYYLKIQFFQGRRIVMDFIHPKQGLQIYGVPIGGIGAGTIGRGYRGEFCRYQLRPGMYEYNSIFANQFIVTIRNAEGITLFQSILSSYKRPTKILRSWKSEIDPSKCQYTGLYPRSWSEYDLSEFGVKLICRQISPVIPNNYKDSSFPGAVFVWTVENVCKEMRTVTITFTYRSGTDNKQSKTDDTSSTGFVTDDANGILIKNILYGAPATFFIASSQTDYHHVSKKLFFNPVGSGEEIWYELYTMGHLVPLSSETSSNVNFDYRTGVYNRKKRDIGVAIAHKIQLEPKTKQNLEFCLGWHMPKVRFSRISERVYEKYYMTFFDKGSDIETAMFMASYAFLNFEKWEYDIHAWQKPILTDKKLPGWYKSALFNESYYLSDGGAIWLKISDEEDKILPSTDPRKEYGRFAYLEGHEYRMYNTYDVHFYASFALAKLFPKLQQVVQYDVSDAVSLEITTTRRCWYDGNTEQRKYKNSVIHDLGDPDEDPFRLVDAYPIHNVSEWRDLNSKFVLCVYRDFMTQVGDEIFLKDMYPSCKNVINKALKWDQDGDGLIENGGFPDQTYDCWIMTGPSAYCGGLWLAALFAMSEMAKKLNYLNDADEYNSILKRGIESFDKKLWNGYSYSFDTSENRNTIMADQLCGLWYLRSCGISDYQIFPREKVKTTLETIFKYNVMQVGDGELGAVNGFIRDGGIDPFAIQSQEIWTGVNYGLASLMIHEGMETEAWKTAGGMFNSIYYKIGLGYETPEALNETKFYRSIGYMRPLSIWSMQLAWELQQKKGILN